MTPQIPEIDILSLEAATPYLSPLIPSVLESFWESWGWVQQLLDSHPLARTVLNSSTMAGIVSDAFGYFAFPRLIEEHRARLRNIGRSRLAVIHDAILLRFKKFTPDLHSMSIHTEAQHEISHQQQLLPNGRRLTAITLGYTQNSLATEITGVYFSCPVGWKQNLWVLPIYQADNGQLDMFSPLPSNPDEGESVNETLNVDIRIKRKREAKKA
jgi:hypothetical protein